MIYIKSPLEYSLYKRKWPSEGHFTYFCNSKKGLFTKKRGAPRGRRVILRGRGNLAISVHVLSKLLEEMPFRHGSDDLFYDLSPLEDQ